MQSFEYYYIIEICHNLPNHSSLDIYIVEIFASIKNIVMDRFCTLYYIVLLFLRSKIIESKGMNIFKYSGDKEFRIVFQKFLSFHFRRTLASFE